jgi:hypothetical protein
LQLITDHQRPLLITYEVVPVGLLSLSLSLSAETEFPDQGSVAVYVLTPQVLEQAAATTDHPQQATA